MTFKMLEYFRDPYRLLLLIICLVILMVLLSFLCCSMCRRRRKKNTSQGEEVTMDSLLFVFETDLEKQQPTSPGKEGYSQCDISFVSSDLNITEIRRSKSSGDFSTLCVETKFPDQYESAYLGFGRICMSLAYNNQQLTVHVKKGLHIHSKHPDTVPSPYLKVCLLPDEKRLYSKTQKGNSPSFNESFTFPQIKPESDLATRILKITVCDFDRFSRQNILGYVILPIVEEEQKLINESETGDIWKEIVETDILPGLNKGEIQFSISHLPTAKRLTLCVNGARDLYVNPDKDSEVLVKVDLFVNGRVVKTKKTTSIKQSIANPTFNESFVFSIASLDRTSVIVSVHVVGSSGKKRLLGKLHTGPSAKGDGLVHWNQVLSQPRIAHAKWHSLF